MRTIKAPEIRKQEIQEAAMKLFREKGYEQTSMADIAHEIHVVQGLCYRYFSSKQELFGKVLDLYAEECCRPFAAVICDESRTLAERMDRIFTVMENPPEERYQAFFHRQGNEAFHELLAVRICRYMVPYLSAELEKNAVENPESTAEFIIYGQFAFWQTPVAQMRQKLSQYKKLVYSLLPDRK